MPRQSPCLSHNLRQSLLGHWSVPLFSRSQECCKQDWSHRLQVALRTSMDLASPFDRWNCIGTRIALVASPQEQARRGQEAGLALDFSQPD